MSEFLKLAYRKLGLPMEGHDIGTMRYIDLPAEALFALCELHLNSVNPQLYKDRPRRPETLTPAFRKADEEWRLDIRCNCFLLYRDWLWLIKHPSYTPEPWDDYAVHYDKRVKAIVEWDCVWQNREAKYDHDLAGRKQYLRETCPQFYEFLCTDVPVRLPPKKLLHLYCVSGSQSGKTELLKLMAHEVYHKPDQALVFIEPGGEAADQIFQWKENSGSDRLIYVDPYLELGMTPVINPFQIYGVKPSETSDYALSVKRAVALHLVEALQEIISKGQGGEISGNMEMMLTHCILVLLDYPGATFRHLSLFMDRDRADPLVEFARTRSHYPRTVDFFTHTFVGRRGRELEVTKNAIDRKLQHLFLTGIFENLTCGPSTIQLEAELEKRKIIVFNFSKGAMAGEGSAFGGLITALLLGIAFRRNAPHSRNKPIPIRYIMDECHNFVAPSVGTIITEGAKHSLFITMAQVHVGQGMSTELKDAASNTSVQIGGANKALFYDSVAKLLYVKAEDIAALNRGEFIIHLSGSPPFKFRTNTNLLRWTNRMSEERYEAFKKVQLDKYYRPISRPALPPRQEILPPARVELAPSRPKRAPKVESGVAVRVVDPDEDKPGRWGA